MKKGLSTAERASEISDTYGWQATLNRLSFGPAGYGMPDELILRTQARDAIRTGKLPCRKPDRIFGGTGNRRPCAVCGDLITPDQPEIELEFNGQGAQTMDRYYLHVRCLAAWEFEWTKLPA